jgi:hypothetical protein
MVALLNVIAILALCAPLTTKKILFPNLSLTNQETRSPSIHTPGLAMILLEAVAQEHYLAPE